MSEDTKPKKVQEIRDGRVFIYYVTAAGKRQEVSMIYHQTLTTK